MISVAAAVRQSGRQGRRSAALKWIASLRCAAAKPDAAYFPATKTDEVRTSPPKGPFTRGRGHPGLSKKGT